MCFLVPSPPPPIHHAVFLVTHSTRMSSPTSCPPTPQAGYPPFHKVNKRQGHQALPQRCLNLQVRFSSRKERRAILLSRECIVITRSIIDGLLTALHIKLNHLSQHQLKQVVLRYFYALDLDKALGQCSHTCRTCAPLKKIPSCLTQQSTSHPPAAFAKSFAADVLKRNRRITLAARKTVSSVTTSCIVEDERRDILRAILICSCLELRPISGPCAVGRVDSAPGFAALANDEFASLCFRRFQMSRK